MHTNLEVSILRIVLPRGSYARSCAERKHSSAKSVLPNRKNDLSRDTVSSGLATDIDLQRTSCFIQSQKDVKLATVSSNTAFVPLQIGQTKQMSSGFDSQRSDYVTINIKFLQFSLCQF